MLMARVGVKSLPFCFLKVERFLPMSFMTMKLRPLGWPLSTNSYTGQMLGRPSAGERAGVPCRFFRIWYSNINTFFDLSAFSTLRATVSLRSLSSAE